MPRPDRRAVARQRYERIATAGCADRTLRHRLPDWAGHVPALEQLSRVVGE